MASRSRDAGVPADVRQARTLARRIVAKQGVQFIRELLRGFAKTNNDVRIGANRATVVANLDNAIMAGHIGLDAIRAWVDEVEGWGRQHIYLFHVGQRLARARWVRNETELRRKLASVRLASFLGRRDELSFSDELDLGEIGIGDDAFRCVWRQGTTKRTRDESEDRVDTIDGDEYEFHAYRIEPLRAVMRFELRPSDGLAALFLQRPLAQHEEAIDKAKVVLGKLGVWGQLRPANIGQGIRRLDQQDLRSATSGFRSRQARFQRDGATIDFGVSAGLQAWKDVQEVRDVRQSLNPSDFSGEKAQFRVTLPGTGTKSREVVLAMSAVDRRMYFQAQMRAGEVWNTLRTIGAHTR